jgi:glycosyltransferase involved in cell wall biosynthesis
LTFGALFFNVFRKLTPSNGIAMAHLPTCSTPPLVTVVIPAYNAAGSIETTLISVMKQTHRNLEIVVVDDGSTDDTAAIVARFAAKDSRIRLLQQPNGGLAAARNSGIRAAKGEYIANIDADDVWRGENIERQLNALENAPFDAKVVYGWSMGIDESNRLNGSFFMSTVEGCVYPVLVYKFFVSNASSSLIHRTCFENLGAYGTRYVEEGAQGCEDWDLHLRFAKEYRFAVAPSFLIGYRQTTGNMSSNADEMYRSYLITMENARKTCPGISSRAFRWSSANFTLYLALNISHVGDFRAVWKWLLKALIRDPWMTLMRHDFHILLIRSFLDAFLQCVSNGILARKMSYDRLKSSLFEKKAGAAVSTILRRIRIYHRLPAQRWERRRIAKLLNSKWQP